MIVGVPKEIKNEEYRVAVTPNGVKEFVRAGHTVIVENGAGVGSGFDDAAYKAAGAVLYDNGVTGAHELLDAVRRDRNAVLLVLDLLGDTDDHDSSSLLIPIVTLLMRTRVRACTVWQFSI